MSCRLQLGERALPGVVAMVGIQNSSPDQRAEVAAVRKMVESPCVIEPWRFVHRTAHPGRRGPLTGLENLVRTPTGGGLGCRSEIATEIDSAYVTPV
jgi:hypothetical protein